MPTIPTTSTPFTTTTTAPTSPPPQPKIWALLVAGSNGFGNYRHQADVCHAYQILHANGIPDENIIVMMYDDIANNEDNPTPGIIINHPGGPNVYQGVPKDYTGADVNAQNFLNVLSGNKIAMQGIGSGRVIESGPDDVLFVNFVDHGGPGVLYFPNDELMADKLIKTISKMNANSKYAKLILYVEACHAGSMFDNLLPDTTNVFVLSAADPHESSYACYYDEQRETYLGDVFSIIWMNDTEHESLPQESLHHQFERVRTFTNTSHVEEYGDLDIGSTKLKNVLGFRMRTTARYSSGRSPSAPTPLDVADNMDVPLIVLQKRILKERNPLKRKDLKLEKNYLVKKRMVADDIMKEVITKASGDSYERMNELRASKYGLNWKTFYCYRQLYEAFNKLCMNAIQSPYVRVHLQKLINMCSVNWLTTTLALEAITDTCQNGISNAKYMKIF